MVPLKTIDVAIGISFLYLLLTFGASAVVEMISTARNWRAHMLHDTIRNMLNPGSLVTVSDIYNNPLVRALCRSDAAPSPVDLLERYGWRPEKGGTPPSYIPAATFSGAVLDTLLNKAASAVELSPDGAIKEICSLLRAPTGNRSTRRTKLRKEDALRSILMTTLATQGASIQAVRFALEKWFNDTMDRTAGWYKRRTQACLLLIGLVIAFGGNLNTIAVARWLWQGDAARQAAVAAARDYVSKNPLPQTPTCKEPDTSPQSSCLTDLASRIVGVDQSVGALQYPIGWPHALYELRNKQPADNLPTNRTFWFLEYLFGALITALAISMGSTFWFDAVQNLIKIRGAGPKPSSR